MKEKINQQLAKLDDVLMEMRNVLQSERFILTGGFSFHVMGLTDGKLPGDIDLALVKPSHNALDFLRTKCKEVTIYKYSGKPVPMVAGDENASLFQCHKNGIKIDIWVSNTYDIPCPLKYKGVDVYPLLETLKHKKRCDRDKDHDFCIALAEDILHGFPTERYTIINKEGYEQ